MKPLVILVLLFSLSAATAQQPVAPEDKAVKHWIDQLKSPELRQHWDEDFRELWHAAYVLGTLGPKAAPAVPALHEVLVGVNSRDKYCNEYARSMATWALGRIGPAAESEIPVLAETMTKTELLAVRRSAAEALGNFGPAAKPAVGDLLKMLGNVDEITCVNAAVALWKIDRHPKALPALLEMLRRGTSSRVYPVAVVLGQMGQEAEKVAPALIEALHSPSPDVRRAAARSLGQLGKAAFPALSKSKALQDPDADVRRMVVEALDWMGPDAVQALTAALKDKKSPAVRRAAARALGNLGAAARSARPALVTAASDPDEEVHIAAAKALQLIPSE